VSVVSWPLCHLTRCADRVHARLFGETTNMQIAAFSSAMASSNNPSGKSRSQIDKSIVWLRHRLEHEHLLQNDTRRWRVPLVRRLSALAVSSDYLENDQFGDLFFKCWSTIGRDGPVIRRIWRSLHSVPSLCFSVSRPTPLGLAATHHRTKSSR